MGAINYKTSDYITLALEPVDNEFFEQDIREEVEKMLDNYSFYYFHVVIKSGYYEGFSVDIENNFSIFFDDAEEKREAQKEITQIKAFLIDCMNNGLVSTVPSWCTAYKNIADTKADISKAIQDMRAEVSNTPTYYTLKAKGEI